MYENFEYNQGENYQKIIGSAIVNKHGLEVLMPTFKSMESIEALMPKCLAKLPKELLQDRLDQLEEVLDDDYAVVEQEHIKSINTSESSYMHQLIIKEQVKPMDCYFQNDYFLCFSKNPTREDLDQRALIFAKVFMKHYHSRQPFDTSIYKLSNDGEGQSKSMIVQQQLNLSQNNAYQAEVENQNLDVNIELNKKVDVIFEQLVSRIDQRVFECYERGELDKCISWKQRKADLERDVDNVEDPKQLLSILGLFKIHYKL